MSIGGIGGAGQHEGGCSRRSGHGGGGGAGGVIGGLRSSASSLSLALPAARASLRVLAFGAFSLVFFVSMSVVFKTVNFCLRFVKFWLPWR